MKYFKVVTCSFFALLLTACTSQHIPSPDYASLFAGRFAAEFDEPGEAKELWMDYGGRVVRKVQERVYPAVSFEVFSERAINRIREVRSSDPMISLEVLSFVALDAFYKPVWLEKSKRTAVFYSVDAISEDGSCSRRIISIIDRAEQCMPARKSKATTYRPAPETDLGVATLTVPELGASLLRHNRDPGLARELKAHKGPIILDLRENGGGLLESVEALADIFLPPGNLVLTNITQDEKVRYSTRKYLPGGPVGPVLILIDKDTNSGATAVAAALQDHGVGQIAGVASYEIKAGIETVIPLTTCPPEIERCAVSIPTGKMHRPSGAPLDIPMIVDYPIDTRNPDALADTVAAWRAEIAEPPVN